ncbi:pyruvate dehydrogenase complex dihydrolipoamide acetyltransferase [Hymenobacter actinosclerus]|uniref:Acetyltransferase component of pyruvate dehydrogenase complex n=1 Tax=Hymenobacter actinosclerus TaxID=82805 RepID=A0A1I0FA10_9BACT|nr:pyruvate dehydrogenase complex dihydrolipoamide acetyltransferase [Hymenobacter actinosclerus]SET54957.1 pyruvate dehydrogenase E2 component (dihydrolipoamide acetyltransferase) [Hymenobacter actinosclerus]
MAELIKMPKMSDTMTEGVIAAWLKKVGDKVKSGDVLAEVETDKATMELENYEDGTLLYVGPKEGEAVVVNGLLAIVGKEGEDIAALLKDAQAETAQLAAGETAEAPAAPAAEASAPAEAPKAAPAAAAEAPAAPKAEPAKPAAPAGNGKKATVIRMPKMSDTMTEGTIAAWLKKVGDKVKSGDILAEVETDKATMELDNYEDGTLLYIGPKEGEAVPVDGVLAIIGEEGADVQALLGGQDAAAGASPADEAATERSETENAERPAEIQAEAKATGQTSASTSQAAPAANGGRIFASPLAKSIAKDKGIDLHTIKGSGENGRIVSRDLEDVSASAAPAPAAAPAATAPAAAAPQSEYIKAALPEQAAPKAAPAAAPAAQPADGTYTDTPVSQMRKVIARRLSESLFTAPHFYLTMEILMDRAMEVRTQLNELSPVKLSFNDLVIKASALALRQHPAVNSSWLGDKIRQNHVINIGVAVAVDEGLLVPVVRNADGKGMSQIATEVKELAGKAKSKKLQPAEWEGNTFTISNLGMFGIDEFTAIINSPDACILAVGGIKQTAVVKNGELAIGNIMKVTLSCDHRVVDGATGAAFLQTLKSLLEDPLRMLI